MSSPPKVATSVPRAENTSPGPSAADSPLSHANLTANGEQDQGIPFKGPNATEGNESAIAKTPDLESGEFAKPAAKDALRPDSFKNIGNRRRSSASNQPSVNLRKGSSSNPSFLIVAQGYSKDNEMARHVGA
jgi:hypothetical protein